MNRNSLKAAGLKRLWKLKPLTKLCTDFFVLDIETGYRRKDGFVHWALAPQPERLIFAVIYGWNYSKVFFSVDEIIKELQHERFHNKKVFAHNGGGFDYLGIFGNIYNVDPEAIFNGKFISFTNGNCTFADSGNIFIGASVEVIGKMMNLHKGVLGSNGKKTINKFPRKGIYDLNVDGIPVNVEFEKPVTKDIQYCHRDCRIVWEALFSVFEFAGEIKITQASLSMSYFRRFHQPFHIDHNENQRFFWESYYGGRTEAFKIGKTHAKVIDINSSYPYNMRRMKFPNPKFLKYEKNISVKLFLKYLEWYEGCAKITVLHDHAVFGFLPYKHNGKLLFPVGEFTGTWNFPEIRFALEKGVIKILAIDYVSYAEPMESPFVSFVDTLNRLKTEAKISGNLFEEDRAKRLMNSLYGKFAQRIIEESIYLDDIEKNWNLIQEHQAKGTFLKLLPFSKKRNDAFLITKASKKVDVSYAIPSFASYITSGGRVMLLEKMLEFQNRKIVYCDTDSIFFEVDDGTIKNEYQLGGWKIEEKTITEIRGLKNYKYIKHEKPHEEIWRVKGVPVNKGKKITLFPDDDSEIEVPIIEQIGENIFKYYNLIKTREALKRNIEPGILTERIKKIKNTYDKRIVFKNGETKPIEL